MFLEFGTKRDDVATSDANGFGDFEDFIILGRRNIFVRCCDGVEASH